jgi:hypothetical protein
MPAPEDLAPGTRAKIGAIDGDPVTSHPHLDALSEQQRALRLAVIQEFKSRKVKKYVEKQVRHINVNERVAEGIEFLFDEEGRPPKNMPMEDIVAERRQIEYQIRWFEAILDELQNRLVRVKEIEDHALDLLAKDFGDD